jgi:hypothetical protein
MNIHNNSYFVFPHPIGMHRLVEDTIPVQYVHPMGMHPYRMQGCLGYPLFLPSDTFLRNVINVLMKKQKNEKTLLKIKIYENQIF